MQKQDSIFLNYILANKQKNKENHIKCSAQAIGTEVQASRLPVNEEDKGKQN